MSRAWLLAFSGCLVDPAAYRERRAELECGSAVVDADGDGAAVQPRDGCPAPPKVDCDDTDAEVHPDATELPGDGVDGDCDGVESCFVDRDGDGIGTAEVVAGEVACDAEGESRRSDDCADEDPDVFPEGAELACNNLDDDCDASTLDVATEKAGDGIDDDCDGFELCWVDLDRDGWGGTAPVLSADLDCDTDQVSARDGDCDDSRPDRSPEGVELCNRVDDNCDGLVDQDDPLLDASDLVPFPSDADGDGYGDPDSTTLACFPPPFPGDCDDADPLATVAQSWFDDEDGDGVGDGVEVVFQCLNPGQGLVPSAAGTDCDDVNVDVFPGQLEDCYDGGDQDCDGLVDCDDTVCFGVGACPTGCADDVWAPTNLPATYMGTTVMAGDDDVAACQYTPGGLDWTLLFTPPVSGTVSLDLMGSAFDTVLYVRDDCGGLLLACNDDFPPQLWSALQIQVTAGVPVVVVVDGFNPASRGAFTLNAR